MEWLKRILHKSTLSQEFVEEEIKLTREIWQAHRDVEVAQQKLNEAVEPDQIDYAIYIVEAAEKRLNMLIKEARKRYPKFTEENIELPKPSSKTLDM